MVRVLFPAVLAALARPQALLSPSPVSAPWILGATETGCSLDQSYNKRMVEQLTALCNSTPTVRLVVNLYDVPSDGRSCLAALPSCVLRVTRHAGYKPTYWRLELTPAKTVGYDFVWLFDNDMAVGDFDIRDAVSKMSHANVGLAQPLVKELNESASLARQAYMQEQIDAGKVNALFGGADPRQPIHDAKVPLTPDGCGLQRLYRVEVQTPIFSARAWHIVYTEMIGIIPPRVGNTSDFCIDFTWCNLLAAHLQNNYSACAAVSNILGDQNFAGWVQPGYKGESLESVENGKVQTLWFMQNFPQFYRLMPDPKLGLPDPAVRGPCLMFNQDS